MVLNTKFVTVQLHTIHCLQMSEQATNMTKWEQKLQ